MSTQPANKSLVDDPFLQDISYQLKASANSTSEDLSRRFLPNPELTEILSHTNLTRLYENFFEDVPMRRASSGSRAPKVDVGSEEASENANRCLEAYAEKTLCAPSRISLLALLLYDPRSQSLEYFKEWLSDQRQLPSDEDLPLSHEKAESAFPRCDVNYILDHQAVFTPLIIREGEHELLLSNKRRKPFVNPPELINKGASGRVYKVKIAAGHWTDEKYGDIRPTTKDITVAMKVFQKRENDITAESATEHFTSEREFLARLKENHTSHRLIVQDLGSITETVEKGEFIHSLFFELAVCNLGDILSGKDIAKPYKPSGSTIIAKTVDLLEALACLHSFRFLHLDLKPDNILVFRGGKDKGDYLWKFGDFDLSMEKRKHSEQQELELQTSRYSTVPAARVAGKCQAPEIQYHHKSPASEGSDCWSMGVIILLLLALAYQGTEGVKQFENGAKTHDSDTNASCWLFYVTTEMKQWPKDPLQLGPFQFLDNFKPETGAIGEGLEAIVHPGVLEESRRLYHATPEPECQRLRKALCVVFKHILVINRKNRLKASKLHREFIKVRDYDPSSERQHSQLCRAMQSSNTDDLDDIMRNLTATRTNTPDTDMQSSDANSDSSEINLRSIDANSCCPLCMEYPIHQALKKNNSEFLRKLLSGPWHVDVNLPCPDSHLPPIAIACEDGGDWSAIRSLFEYRKSQVQLPADFYKTYKDSLKKNAKDALRRELKVLERRNSESFSQRSSRSGMFPLRLFRTSD